MIKEEWNGVLVFIECKQQKIEKIGLELAQAGKELAEQLNAPLYAIAITENSKFIEDEIAKYPFDKVYLYETKEVFSAVVYEHCMAECIGELQPEIVLIGGTDRGRAFASRVSTEFRTGITADCTELDLDDNRNMIQTRPAFGGNVMASIMTQDSRPQIATIRQGMWDTIEIEENNNIQFIYRNMSDIKTSAVLIEQMIKKQDAAITSQNILVAVGRGIKCKEDLEMIEHLAELLGGKMASSRALVEKGWISQSQQIGLSGNTVAPKLLITVGISGSVQFMAGMKKAKNIIAINSDENAPIFDIAHFPIVGDLYEVIPELIKTMEGRDVN